jgi:hypothetical protein
MSSGPPITAIERSRGGARLNNTANRLLAALPSSILNLIELHFTAVTFVAGTIVHQAGDEIDHLYFPSAGFASLQIVSRDGRLVDTALVGRESAMGPVAGVGRYKSKVRWVVRSTLAAVKISGIEFRPSIQPSTHSASITTTVFFRKLKCMRFGTTCCR